MVKAALDEPDPRKIDLLGATVSDEAFLKTVNFCSKWSDVVELIAKYEKIGTSQMVLLSGPDKDSHQTIRTKNTASYFQTKGKMNFLGISNQNISRISKV